MSMYQKVKTKNMVSKVLIKKCHCCGNIMESSTELKRCPACNKSFLPSNYFSKVHAKNSREFEALFMSTDEMHDEDFIIGLNVLW